LANQKRAQAVILVLLAGVSLLLLIGFRAAEQTPDSLSYAQAARAGQQLFHPHHLLFNPITRLVMTGLTLFGGPADAVLAGQVHVLVYSAACVLLFYLIVLRLTSATIAALLAAGSLFMTRGFWLFSTQVEVYVPAAAWLIAIAAMIALNRGQGFSILAQIVMSVFLSLAVLYHQTNVLFVIPLAGCLIAAQGRRGGGTAVRVIFLAGATVLLTYYLAFALVEQGASDRSFFSFCFRYALWSDQQWGTFGNYSLEGVATLARSQLWDMVAWPRGWRFAGNVSLGSLILVCFAWNAGQVWRRAEACGLRLLLLAWLAVYCLFFLWWLPREPEFFVGTLPPILLLIVLAANDLVKGLEGARWPGRVVVSVFLGCFLVMAVLTFKSTVLPWHRSRGLAYDTAFNLAATAPPGAMVGVDWSIYWHVGYYFSDRKIVNVVETARLFYLKMKIQDKLVLEKTGCLVVPLSFVSPDSIRIDCNGDCDPAGWARYLGWLLGFKFNGQGEVVACREFRVQAGRGEELYLFVRGEETAAGGFRSIVERLGEQTAPLAKGEGNPFLTWLATAYPRLGKDWAGLN